MKKVISTILVLASLSLTISCKEKPKTPEQLEAMSKEITDIVFDKEVYNFDTIQQGDKVKVDFKFTNVGKHALKIDKARASCGCTVPNWPKEFVEPGASKNIHVVFNSANKSGAQNKAVTIFANVAGGKKIVRLKGFVKTDKTKK